MKLLENGNRTMKQGRSLEAPRAKERCWPRLVFITAVLATLVTAGAHADNFKLVTRPVDGRGIPYAPPLERQLCSAYLRNLNTLSLSSLRDIECSRPVHPSAKNFEKPDWKKLDPEKHANLIWRFEQPVFGGSKSTSADFAEWLPKFQQRIREGKILLNHTTLDVDDDGIREHLIKYESDGVCSSEAAKHVRETGASYFIVNKELSDVDGFSKKGFFLVPGVRHDVFTYKRRPYFDFISSAQDTPRLVVLQTSKWGSPVPVCEYEILLSRPKQKAGDSK